MSKGFSRRGFLTGALTTVAAAGAGAGLAGCDRGAKPAAAASTVVPFRGAHQAGIATPAQDRLAFAAFDVTTRSKAELIQLLRQWTDAAEKMTRGEPIGAVDGTPEYVPADTGEATGLDAADLTITIGFGPGLFDDRFGLAAKRPAALKQLPAFKGDELDAAISGGDLCIQACANDPQVAFHAVRNLNRMGFGVTAMRYFQLGFGRTSSTTAEQQTERNLLGFKDGTRNINADVAAELDNHVWVGAAEQPWLAGGSYLVSRKIEMSIEAWDRDRIGDQEAVIGRSKVEGAPLTGTHEHDEPNLTATDDAGLPRIPAHAHIRLAAPESNGGVKILRRGYSFTDGVDAVTGQLNAGLFFICYQSNPESGFIPVQRNLANDALNEYVTHTSSAVFACPPGVAAGEYWGQQLFS